MPRTSDFLRRAFRGGRSRPLPPAAVGCGDSDQWLRRILFGLPTMIGSSNEIRPT